MKNWRLNAEGQVFMEYLQKNEELKTNLHWRFPEESYTMKNETTGTLFERKGKSNYQRPKQQPKKEKKKIVDCITQKSIVSLNNIQWKMEIIKIW